MKVAKEFRTRTRENTSQQHGLSNPTTSGTV
jgi:hypothetical protein